MMQKTRWTTLSLQNWKVDSAAFVALLKVTAKNRDLDTGVKHHAELLKRGLLTPCSSIVDTLINMYSNCGALANAHALVVGLSFQDAVTWTVLISAYVQQGQPEDALDCFASMQHEGVPPDAVTFACVLKACGSTGAVDKGKHIHDKIVEQGLLQRDVVLGTALVDMYCKCGALAKAQWVLEGLPKRDVICWNALIAAYAQQRQSQDAFKCFERMQNEGLSPSAVTFTCILQACGSIGAIDKGIKIHDEIVREGLLSKHLALGTALVDMYAKCGALARAHQVLEELPVRDVVSWSALIAGYAQHEEGELALVCFELMQREGLFPNALTLVCVLKACGSIGAGNKGEQIHNEIIRQGLLGSNVVLGNALVSMYLKCGALAKAQQVFEDLPARNVVSWSTLIAGYVEQGQGNSALATLKRMQLEGVSPNAVTFTSILKACGSFGCIQKGEQIHDEMAKQGLLATDIVLGSALVDMYAKCGALEIAQRVLEELPGASVVPWSALIAGYAQKGRGVEALNCFRQMQHKGISPDAVTLSSVLNSCSLSGLLDEGQNLFTCMSSEFCIRPGLEHYTCMVDLFRHAGNLDNAVAVIKKLPTFGDTAARSALLGSCRKWGNIDAAKWVFEQCTR